MRHASLRLCVVIIFGCYSVSPRWGGLIYGHRFFCVSFRVFRGPSVVRNGFRIRRLIRGVFQHFLIGCCQGTFAAPQTRFADVGGFSAVLTAFELHARTVKCKRLLTGMICDPANSPRAGENSHGSKRKALQPDSLEVAFLLFILPKYSVQFFSVPSHLSMIFRTAWWTSFTSPSVMSGKIGRVMARR